MCNDCGCNLTAGDARLVQAEGEPGHTPAGPTAVGVLRDLLADNDRQAAHNRVHFDRYRVLAVNLMSSPGSGKTALLEATIEALAGALRIAVIEGDLETEHDAQRIRARGVPAVQITTGSACHLDAHMVHSALHQLDLDGLDIVFIENVGNLVCPAGFDLGQHYNVTLLSVTEGDDKPAKYPVLFRITDLLLLSKADLLPMLDDFEPERARQYMRNLANGSPVHTVSARKGTGLEDWLRWLHDRLQQHRQQLAQYRNVPPRLRTDGGGCPPQDPATGAPAPARTE